MSKFSIRLKTLRSEKELSQQELANIIGISKSSINMYERGEREPSIETLEAFADFFNVDMDYLMGRQEKQKLIDLSYLVPNKPTKNTTNLIKLTKHERDVISSYRNHPEMQPAVDRLLGVSSISDHLMPIAARNDHADDPEELERMKRDLDKL